MRAALDRFFGLTAHRTDVATEVRAGIATFLTMGYVLLVNPQILASAGMPAEDVAIATALSAAVATLVMGLWANYPFALAPGMGLNAYFAFGVVGQLGVPWPVALTAVFAEGILFLALSLGGARRVLLEAIPASLKLATTVGIGLFLAHIGLQNAGLVTDHSATLVTLGDVRAPAALAALGGLLVLGTLVAARIPGAILIGIGFTTGIAWLTGLSPLPSELWTTPRLPRETLWAIEPSRLADLALVPVVLAFLFVDVFDTAGTLVGLGRRAGALDERGRLPRANRAFLADAIGTTVGAALGTSTVTSYIESAAGVEEGGRTGLTAVVVALLFASSIIFAPLFVAIPPFATAPALLVVGALMMEAGREVDWPLPEEGIPAFLTVAIMPLTYSIANGISAGIVSWVALRLLRGRWREVPLALLVTAGAIVLFFATVRGG